MRDILAGIDETEKKEPRDILTGLDEAPPEMEEAPEIPEEERIPEEMPEENKYGEVGHQQTAGMTHVPENFRDIMEPGIASNLRDSLMQGAGQDAIKFNNFLASHPITNALFSPMKELELGKAPMPGVAKTTAAILPWMATGAVGTGLKAIKGTAAAAKMIGKLPTLAKGLENVARTHPIMTKAGKLFGTGAAEMAAIEKVFGDEGDQSSKLGNAALMGGIINLVPHAVLGAFPHSVKGISNTLKKISETKGGIATPEEAQSAVDLFKGAEHVLNLPDVIRMPKLSSFTHNLLRHIPGSAVATKEKDMIRHMERSGASAMNDLLGEAGRKMEPVDVVKLRKGIAGEVADVGSNIKNESSKLYKQVFEEAKKTDFKFKPTKIADLAKNYEEKAIRAGEDLKDMVGTDFATSLQDFTGVLKEEIPTMAGKPIEDVKTLEAIRKAQRKAGIVPKVPVIDMERLKDLRSEVGSKYFRKRGTAEGRKWGELYNAINEDFSKGAKDTGNEKLIPLFNKANDYYKEEYVPFFKNKKIDHIMRGRQIKGKTDFVEKTLSDSDNQKVLNYLPEKTRNKLSYLMLDKGIKDNGEPVVPRVLKSFKGLTEYDKDNVLTSASRKKFEELSKKYEVAKPSYRAMGDNVMQGLHQISKSRHIAHTAALGAGGLFGLTHLTGLLPFAGAGALAGRALGSKKLLEAYTKGIIPFEKGAPEVAKRIAMAGKMGVSLGEEANR